MSCHHVHSQQFHVQYENQPNPKMITPKRRAAHLNQSKGALQTLETVAPAAYGWECTKSQELRTCI